MFSSWRRYPTLCARRSHIVSSSPRLMTVADAEQVREVGIVRRHGSRVLGSIEVAGPVLVVAVQSNSQDATAKELGQLVIVVPAVPARAVLVAMRSEPSQGDKVQLAALVQPAERSATDAPARSCTRRRTRASSPRAATTTCVSKPLVGPDSVHRQPWRLGRDLHRPRRRRTGRAYVR